jgi:uncharacterized repeat protein (TIGR01451 family)
VFGAANHLPRTNLLLMFVFLAGCIVTVTAPAQTLPLIDAKGAAVIEGNSGTTNLTFILTLSKPSLQTVMVDYATRDASAEAGSDYSAAFGVAIFPPGVTNQQILVSVNGDLLSEDDETFWLMLTNAVNATLAKDHAIGTILNDDAPPALTINDVALVEGYTTVTNALFNVSLSKVSGQTITVDYLTTNGTAMAADQFVPVSDMLTFVPGSVRQTLSVPVTSGTLQEATADFSVHLLNAVNASIARNHATATIISDGPLRTLLASHKSEPMNRGKPETATQSSKSPLKSDSPLRGAGAGNLSSRLPVPIIIKPEPRTNSSNLPPALSGSSSPVSSNSLKTLPRRGPDLSFGLFASTNLIHVEKALKFVFAVTNNGQESASSVFVTNWLPASATFISARTSQGTFAKLKDVIVFNLGTLSNTASANAEITLKFSAAGSATNVAQISSSPIDTAPANKVAASVVLAVNDLPRISTIPGQVSRENEPTTPIPFNIADTETPASRLILFGDSSNTNLVPDENFIFGGVSSNRTLILVPARNQTGATEIGINLIDAEGGEARAAFNLTVLPASHEMLHISHSESAPVATPKIDRIEQVDGFMRLHFNSEPGHAYTIECCDALSSSSSWYTLTNIGSSTVGALVEFSDPIAERPQRFYRLRVPEVNPPGSQIALSFDAAPGQGYAIEYCDSLRGPWQVLTNIPPVSSQAQIVVLDSSSNQPQRFYRLRSP